MRLREIRNLARGFRFMRVFVAVIQTELRGSEDRAVTLSCLKLLSLTKDCFLGLDQVSESFPLCPRPFGQGWGVNLKKGQASKLRKGHESAWKDGG